MCIRDSPRSAHAAHGRRADARREMAVLPMDPGAALNEFQLVRRFFDRAPNRAVLGVGDDAALLRPDAGLELAVTTDMLVEGRHFAPGADPRAPAPTALAVTRSAPAAMGAA